MLPNIGFAEHFLKTLGDGVFNDATASPLHLSNKTCITVSSFSIESVSRCKTYVL